MKKEIGLIEWFDTIKGFGLVKSINNAEVFVHTKNFKQIPEKILTGTALIFQCKQGRGRLEGINCHPPGSYEDWKLISSLLGQDDIVNLQVEISGRGKRGNPYRRKETKRCSVKSYGAHQLLRTKNNDESFQFITAYAHEELIRTSPSRLYSYAVFVEKKLIGINPIATSGLIADLMDFFYENKNDEFIFQAWLNDNPKILKLDSFFGEVIDEVEFKKNVASINGDQLQKLTVLKNADRLLAMLFDFRFKKFEQEQKSEDFIFLTQVVDSLSDIDTKQSLEKKLSTALVFTPIINEDKLLLAIASRLNTKEAFYTILQNWRHQSAMVSVALLEKLKQLNYEAKAIPENFFKNFSDSVELSQLKKASEILPSEYVIKAILSKYDFTSYDVLNYLKTVSNLDDYKSILIQKINEAFFTIKLDFDFYKLKNITAILNFLDATFYPSQIKEDVDQLVLSKFSDALTELVNGDRLTHFYDLQKAVDILETCNSCVFLANTKQRLIIEFEKFLQENSSNLILIRAWEQNKFPRFENYLFSNIESFTIEELSEILKTRKLQENQIHEILLKKRESVENAEWVLRNAALYFNAENFSVYDDYICRHSSFEVYFNLWKKKLGKIFPSEYIKHTFRTDLKEFYQVSNWLKAGLCSSEEIAAVIFSLIREVTTVEDRKSFYLRFTCLKCLIELNNEYSRQIIEENNAFDRLILWFIGFDDYFDLGLLQRKFIYFSPADQVTIVKRLFYLKNKGLLQFTIQELDNLVRADLDLFLTNQKFHDDFVLDISTSLIIELIKNYEQHNRFLADSQLLKVVLHDMGRDRKKKFQIEHYFETCKGRMNVEWDWHTNGKVSKRTSNSGVHFIVEFEYDAAIVEAVKNIPNRRFDPGSRNWIIPGTSELEVIRFAKENRFFLDLGANNYSNNTHLAKFQRGDVPNGIKFCEGRIANNPDQILASAFWWCSNQKCHQHCETDHLRADDYLSYTLLDILRICNINLDENNQYGFFPHGKYYHLISQINRFNRLLERLYCLECHDILFPVQSSNFAAYTVVRFSCQNANCGQHGKEIYLNHCLDGKCNSIIDSRISKKCENGLYTCNSCGGCCSHEMLSRRLDNLKTTGGVIHPQLVQCVEEKKGHREKNEYFCYHCGGIMTEIIDDIGKGPKFFKCLNCDNIEYRPNSAIERPHIHLRRPDYPIRKWSEITGNSDSNTQSDFPF